MSLRLIAVVLAVVTISVAVWYRSAGSRHHLGAGPTVPSAAVHPTESRPHQGSGPILFVDLHGQSHPWSEFSSYRCVVVVFLGNECPLVQYYATRLEEISRSLASQKSRLVGVNANAQDSLTEISQWKKRRGLTFDIFKDADHVLADRLGATRTPEAFVLSPTGEIVYQGRIDDQYDVGIVRGASRRRTLEEGIDRYLAGQPLEVTRTQAPGCLIGRIKRGAPSVGLTYADDIASIVERACVSCHQPNDIGPFTLLDYADVAHWGPMIRETVESGRMPPWPASEPMGYFANDKRLTSDEKRKLIAWIDGGCPEGRPTQPIKPAHPPTKDGWHIGQPDVEFVIGDRPFEVPASGDIDYQFYTVDPKFTEDRWIQAAEFVPGNRAVVHHAAITLAYPEEMNKPEFGFFGFAPGTSPLVLPPGHAVYIPAGSLLKFQIHYTPIGTPTSDRSKVGLKFIPGDPKLRLMVPFGAIADTSMVIPARSPNFDVWAATMIDKEFELWSIFPHMHLRGKSVMIEALMPDASVKRLLTIPRWDFNWQLTYELNEPIRLPKGTLMHMRAVFDNSSDNPANPDPNHDVRWGRMTNDEMWVIMLNGFEIKDESKVPQH